MLSDVFLYPYNSFEDIGILSSFDILMMVCHSKHYVWWLYSSYVSLRAGNQDCQFSHSSSYLDLRVETDNKWHTCIIREMSLINTKFLFHDLVYFWWITKKTGGSKSSQSIQIVYLLFIWHDRSYSLIFVFVNNLPIWELIMAWRHLRWKTCSSTGWYIIIACLNQWLRVW